MEHGGGMTWVPSTYDPELNLVYVGTGNPQPVIAGKGRKGDNLYTESIVALNLDTGKLVWHFQPSPHDTHDWDAVQTPVLFDGEINGVRENCGAGEPQWIFLCAGPDEWQEHCDVGICQDELGEGCGCERTANPEPSQGATARRSLGVSESGGGANWPPPSYSPATGLFYVNATRAFSVYYIYDDDEKPEGWGGNDRAAGPNRCCRPSTIRPGRFAGATNGRLREFGQAF